MEIIHSEREHASLGGSTASRWMNCLGSVYLISKCPKQESSQAAEAGTEAHECVEKAVKAFLNYKETGVWSSVEDFSDCVPEDKQDELLPVVQETVQVIWEQVLLNSITGKAYGQEDNFEICSELDMHGFVDFWAVYKDKKGKRVGVIFDFKYGYGYVDVKKNAQLAFYAVALRNFIRANGKDLDYVRTAIYQPRNGGSEGKTYREAKLSAKVLDKWTEEFMVSGRTIHNAYKNSVEANLPLKAGDHCKYCPAKAICTKHVTKLQKDTSLLLTEKETKTKLPKPQAMTDKHLLAVVANADAIEEFIAACKAHVIARHNDGKPVEGLKVTLSTPKRKWIDDEHLIVDYLESQGFTEDLIYARKLNSFTKFEKKLSKEDQEIFNSTLLTRGEPKPMVVIDNELNERKETLGSQVDMLKDD